MIENMDFVRDDLMHAIHGANNAPHQLCQKRRFRQFPFCSHINRLVYKGHCNWNLSGHFSATVNLLQTASDSTLAKQVQYIWSKELCKLLLISWIS